MYEDEGELIKGESRISGLRKWVGVRNDSTMGMSGLEIGGRKTCLGSAHGICSGPHISAPAGSESWSSPRGQGRVDPA